MIQGPIILDKEDDYDSTIIPHRMHKYLEKSWKRVEQRWSSNGYINQTKGTLKHKGLRSLVLEAMPVVRFQICLKDRLIVFRTTSVCQAMLPLHMALLDDSPNVGDKLGPAIEMIQLCLPPSRPPSSPSGHASHFWDNPCRFPCVVDWQWRWQKRSGTDGTGVRRGGLGGNGDKDLNKAAKESCNGLDQLLDILR